MKTNENYDNVNLKNKSGIEKVGKREIKVMVSGCFDPLHIGHLHYFQDAKKLGDKLIVVIDNDSYTKKKKGAVFMPIQDRLPIIKELKCVDEAISMDEGEDVSEAILNIKPDIFAKGGDIDSIEKIPKNEILACKKTGCRIVFNVGGGKIRASSVLLKTWVDKNKEQ